MPYFNYNGKRCYYEEKGNADGPMLLFLHGNTASSLMFYGITDEFETDYRTITIDFLGHGQSDRLKRFPADFWYDEGLQVAEFLAQKGCGEAYLIGSSGGAQAALNAALECPGQITKVIADSFEGDEALPEVVQFLKEDRERSMTAEDSRAFYEAMHGEGWESIVENDTKAVLEHAETIGAFFHKPLSELRADLLLTGSLQDEFVAAIAPDFYERLFADLIRKAGKGTFHLFERGGHPAILSNREEFVRLAKEFLKKR